MAENNLPIHPSKRHPLTGEPLRAIWVRPDGRVQWPILGGAPGEGEGDGAGGGAGAGAGGDGSGAGGAGAGDGSGAGGDSEPTWDALRSAWEQGGLTPAQIKGRLEASRRWEQRAKSAPSADELATLRAKAEKHDSLEYELGTASEKAVKDAEKAAREQADGEYRPLLAETAFRVAIGERNARLEEASRKSDEDIAEFIGDLNLSRFLTDDGRVDTAKVLARVDQFAPAMGATQNQQQRRGPSPTGQGNSSGNQRSAPGTGSVGAGRDLYAETHPKKAG
jgi:hypothetical protein